MSFHHLQELLICVLCFLSCPFFMKKSQISAAVFPYFFYFLHDPANVAVKHTKVHRNNKLYWEFKNDELSQASFLHLVSKNIKVFISTQDISVISTDNISHPMYRRALILTSVTSTKTQEEPQTLFAYDSVWRLIWGAKKHARVYYSVWENWMCSTALNDIGGKHYRSRTRLRKNHKSRTATRRAEQTTREKADEFVETKRKIQRTESRKVLNIQVLHSFQMKHLQPCQQ